MDEIKAVILSLDELMKDGKNASLVKSQLDGVCKSVNITALHNSLMPLIPTEKQEKQNEWPEYQRRELRRMWKTEKSLNFNKILNRMKRTE